jgi:demethylmenaquinone methyltransferase/2-methoxy-6-polyprenyl-1,4-benzoquinol methylase
MTAPQVAPCGQADAEHQRNLRRMFGRVARRYDLLNRLMTFGLDRRWRREAIRRARLPPSAWVLDDGAGTGELALEALAQGDCAKVVAVDITPEMLALGRKKTADPSVHWIRADALHLPFASQAFDGVVAGFLLRNVRDLDRALCEAQRVLRDDGTFTCLETTPPPPVARGLMAAVILLLGRLVAQDGVAYQYLLDSTTDHLSAQAMAARMARARLEKVGFRRRMLSSVAIHWGQKAPEAEAPVQRLEPPLAQASPHPGRQP